MKTLIQKEYPLILGLISVLLFFGPGANWLSDMAGNMSVTTFSFIYLFAIMLWASFKVVDHADMLAIKLGEPFGALRLSLVLEDILFG